MSATEAQMVHVLNCPNTDHEPLHPLVEPERLECGHILCRACLDKASTEESNKQTICCPFRNCHKATETHTVTPLFICFQIPTSDVRRLAGACFDAPTIDASGKLMEPDLLYDVDDDDMRHNSPKHSPSHDSFEYADFAKEPPAERTQQQQTVVYTDAVHWDVDRLIDSLITAAKEYFAIQGFAASPDLQKLYVDIDKGHLAEIQKFFSDKFPAQWQSQRIILVEQENQAEFLIYTGEKIAVRPQAIQIGDRIDLLDRYGTLTCLAEDVNSRQYALTAKHIISTENRPQEGDESIVSGLNRRVAEISSHYTGMLGGFPVGGRDKQVDIAAAPLHADVTRRFDQNMIHNLNSTYDGPDSELFGVKVTKRGASSADTSGAIVKPSYYRRDPQQKTITGDHFVIAPNSDHFAVSGDSGALVWSTSGVPIGIVSKGQSNFRYDLNGEMRRENVVFCVRLDHCLSALSSECDVNIVKCKSYGARLPYEQLLPEPQIDDVQDVQDMDH